MSKPFKIAIIILGIIATQYFATSAIESSLSFSDWSEHSKRGFITICSLVAVLSLCFWAFIIALDKK